MAGGGYPSSTFTIQAITKLFSVNADFFQKLSAHNVESIRDSVAT
jgi:hypothetical protein